LALVRLMKSSSSTSSMRTSKVCTQTSKPSCSKPSMGWLMLGKRSCPTSARMPLSCSACAASGAWRPSAFHAAARAQVGDAPCACAPARLVQLRAGAAPCWPRPA
jgi:hypothetical protein